MKTKIAVFILSLFLVSQSAFAATASHKLMRGVEGVVTSPLEYVNQYQLASEKQSLPGAVMTGVLGGTCMTVKRIVNGVYDIVTFPVNKPEGYGLLLKDDAETALQNYSQLGNSDTFPLNAKKV